MKKLFKSDGWFNALTGIGTRRDKRTAAAPCVEELSQQELEDLYRGDDMAARIVEALPDEMLREGFEVQIEGDKDASEAVNAYLDEQEIPAKLHDALCWARAFGGAGILLGVADGKAPTDPLDPERVRSFDWTTVLNRFELVTAGYYTNPLAARYGEPQYFRVQPSMVGTSDPVTGRSPPGDPDLSGAYIHESRVLRFDGVRVPRKQRVHQQGWGDSALLRAHNVLRDFHISWGSAAHLLQDFAQAVFKMEGLAELIASGDDEVVIKRLQMVDLSRSTSKSVLLDSKEEFERKQTPLTDLPNMLDKLSLRLAAAARMPVSLLLGQAPAGLNATGDSDIRWFYDQVAAAQRSVLKPQLNTLLKIIFNAKNGPTNGKEPENWCIKFKPLWQLDALQEADRRLKIAQADAQYVTAGVLTPEEIAASRFGGDEYSPETVLDTDLRDRMAQAPAPEAEAEAKLKPTPAPLPGTPA